MELYKMWIYFDNNGYEYFYDVPAHERIEFEDGLQSGKTFQYEVEDGTVYWFNPDHITRVKIKRQV